MIRRQLGCLLLVAVILVAAGFAAFRFSTRKPPQPAEQPLDGQLSVFIRRNLAAQPVEVDQPGALPVMARGSMSLEVHLNQPAFIYLVWLDSEGNIVPLYPWNTDNLEVKNVDEPPPVRRATKVVFSPLQLGSGWTFGPRGGAETVILLARHTALPDDLKIAGQLTSLPMPEFENSTAFVKTRIPDRQNQSSAPDSNHRALTDFLQPLARHFDLIEAVQFPHNP